jgi:hypothetical protein
MLLYRLQSGITELKSFVEGGYSLLEKELELTMRGFGNFLSATRFCRAFEELHKYFGSSSRRGGKISLEHQRQLFCERLAALQELMGAVA